MALGVVLMLVYPRLVRVPFRKWALLAGVTIAAMAVEKVSGWEVGNGIRCLTALPLGFCVGAGLVIPLSSLRYKETINK